MKNYDDAAAVLAVAASKFVPRCEVPTRRGTACSHQAKWAVNDGGEMHLACTTHIWRWDRLGGELVEL